MSENVGAIEYYIDADTQGLLTAEKTVDKSTKRMESDFNRTGKSVDKFNTRMSKTAQGVNKSMGGMGRSAGQVGIQFQQLVGQIQGGQNAMAALSMQAADIGIVMGAPLLGAVAGLAAAFGGALVPSLFDSKDATEELEEALKSLSETTEQTGDGVVKISDDLNQLAKTNLDLAIAKAEIGIAQARDTIAASASKIEDSLSGIADVSVRSIDSYEAAIKRGEVVSDVAARQYIKSYGALRDFGEQFDLTGEQAFLFGKDVATAFQTLQSSDKSVDDIRAFSETVIGLRDTMENVPESAQVVIDSIIDSARAAIRAGGSMKVLRDKLKNGFDESSEAAGKAKESIDNLVSSLQHQAATAGMTQRQMAIYSATMMAAQNPAIDLAAAIDKINAAFDRIEAAETLSANMKSLESASAQAEKEFQSLVTQWQSGMMALEGTEAQREAFIDDLWEQGVSAGKTREQIQRLADGYRELWAAQDEKKEQKSLERDAETLGVGRGQQIQNQLDDELTRLKELQENKLISEQEYQNRRVNLIQNANERIANLEQQAGLIDWESFGNQAAGAMASVASGAQTGEEAIRGLAVSLLQEAVGSMIQLAIQSATTSATTATAATASMATTAAASTASTAASASANAGIMATTAGIVSGIAGTLASAWAPAALFANMATLGAASGIAVSSMAGAMLATLAIQAIGGLASNAISAATGGAPPSVNGLGNGMGGGRLYGGGVEGGKLYPITENGRPEILTQGNKQYLLPGDSGRVTSNRDMTRNMTNNESNNINLSLNMSPNSPDEFRRQLFDNRESIYNLVKQALNDRGRKF